MSVARPEAGLAADLPPIRYYGDLYTTQRMVNSDFEGNRHESLVGFNVNGESFIRQPWIATVGGHLGLAQVNTTGDPSTDDLVLTGEGRLRLFPVSRFPFEAYTIVSDSRSDTDRGPGQVASDFRSTVLGLVQSYRPTDGRSYYQGRYERATQSDSFGRDEVSDRFYYQSSHRRQHHTLQLNGNLLRSELGLGSFGVDGGDSVDLLNFFGNARHTYQPSAQLSVDSYATYNRISQEFLGRTTEVDNFIGNSLAVWRSPVKPLVLTWDGTVSGNRVATDGESSDLYTADTELSATYEVTRALRLSGFLSAESRRADEDSALTTTQGGTVSYLPAAMDVWGFGYSWYTSAGALNRTGERLRGASGGQEVRGVLGHGLTRAYPLPGLGAVVSGSFDQGVLTEYDTELGELTTLNHNLSTTLVRTATPGATTLVRFNALDSRDAGRDDRTFQSATFQVLHQIQAGRDTSLSANFITSTVHQGTAGSTGDFQFSAAELEYRRNRVFGVSGLQYFLELRADARDLHPFGGGEDADRELVLDTWLDYTIGRLNVRLRATVTEDDGDLESAVMLTVRRLIGGVL